MIGLHDLPEHHQAALRYFSDRGTSHYVGNVALQNGWALRKIVLHTYRPVEAVTKQLINPVCHLENLTTSTIFTSPVPARSRRLC